MMAHALLTGIIRHHDLLTDNYPAETTWTVVDANGETVMSGGPYSSNATTYTSEAVPRGWVLHIDRFR